MGLYGIACKYLKKTEKKVFLDTTFTRFHRFADESPNPFAVLLEVGGNFRIVLNHGFNAATVRKSLSCKDFWEGTVAGTDWQTLRSDSLSGFYQLFSRQDDDFESLCVKKSAQNEVPYIFIAADSVFSDKKFLQVLPFITDIYSVLTQLHINEKSPLCSADDFFAKRRQAVLYSIRLHTVFESLGTCLHPSDFDFMATCLHTALLTAGAEVCAIARDSSLICALCANEHEGVFYEKTQKLIRSLLSPHCAALIQIAKIETKNAAETWKSAVKEYDLS